MKKLTLIPFMLVASVSAMAQAPTTPAKTKPNQTTLAPVKAATATAPINEQSFIIKITPGVLQSLSQVIDLAKDGALYAPTIPEKDRSNLGRSINALKIYLQQPGIITEVKPTSIKTKQDSTKH